MTLLEVLVALTLVSSSGTMMLAVLGASIRHTRQLAVAEAQLGHAQQVLLGYALLPRNDLERRIGQQELDGLEIRVSRPRRTLFRIAIADTLQRDRELLVSVVYRPEVTAQ